MHARALRLVIFFLFGSFPLSVAARRWIVLTCYDDPSSLVFLAVTVTVGGMTQLIVLCVCILTKLFLR